jgi:hypothetical protein
MSLRRDRLSLQGQAQESRHRNIGAHWHSTKTHHSARRDEVSNMCRVPSGVSSDPQTYLHRDQLIKSSDESGAVGQSNYPGILLPIWPVLLPCHASRLTAAAAAAATYRSLISVRSSRTTPLLAPPAALLFPPLRFKRLWGQGQRGGRAQDQEQGQPQALLEILIFLARLPQDRPPASPAQSSPAQHGNGRVQEAAGHLKA